LEDEEFLEFINITEEGFGGGNGGGPFIPNVLADNVFSMGSGSNSSLQNEKKGHH